MDKFFHSVILDKDKCKGCTNCLRRCPTEAIRLKNSKAKINSERCIDCGECIRICPHHAKRVKSDPLSIIDEFKYKIALPSPSLFGQFKCLHSIDIILTSLKHIGFDYIFEVSRGAELVSDVTKKLIEDSNTKKPIISSACPAVVRLIRVRFPELCELVLPMNSPMEVSAIIAKEEASKRSGIAIDDIGVFFITPCPAKVTEIKDPLGKDFSCVDGSIAMSDIFKKLSKTTDKLPLEDVESIFKSGFIGVGWATTEGESNAIMSDRYLAADGIENVIRVLDEVENDRIRNIDFIELNACFGGCVGGVLTVENPYIAKARIKGLKKYLPYSLNHVGEKIPDYMKWDKELKFAPVLNLSDNIEEAMKMMEDIDSLCERLPGLDCGSCGAPSCRALAEDIVKNQSSINDCIFMNS